MVGKIVNKYQDKYNFLRLVLANCTIIHNHSSTEETKLKRENEKFSVLCCKNNTYYYKSTFIQNK